MIVTWMEVQASSMARMVDWSSVKPVVAVNPCILARAATKSGIIAIWLN